MEVWNKLENCNQEEIYHNNNIPRRQKEKHQCPRPEFAIMGNYVKTGGSYIKN